jgi:NAD+ synthase (glutamine-hydrolysing)
MAAVSDPCHEAVVRRIALAQFNPIVGDLAGNAEKILAQAGAAVAAGASLLLTPELALCGYPPEDLALREDFYAENARVLAAMTVDMPAGLTVVVGYPESAEGRHYNSAAVLRDGSQIANYRKQRLPNYAVFDELRTFVAGTDATVFEWAGLRCGLLICEDVWAAEPAAEAHAAGAEVLLVLNASPFHLAKQTERYAVARARVAETGLPLVYLNMVGGQDELVLDGASFALDTHGEVTAQGVAFAEALPCLDWQDGGFRGAIHARGDATAQTYQALVLGVRDYAHKNGFKGALLGLSGGIDSALTLCIAVDALGADQVHAVMMPSEYTADISLTDAEALAENLRVRYSVHPIKPLYTGFLTALADEFSGLPFDTTEENLQARVRGVLLMALSNKFGQIVLTTGNKSEMATGYATLYGDMAGGLAVLKDVTKMRVWALSRYRNTVSAVIPERIITRPPSAELRPDQCDQDSLPPYDILDDILERYMEAQQSPAEIVAAGHDRAVVLRVVRLIDLSEYKRRQSPPGIRITQRGFGRDRRYPITNRYKAPF